MSKEKKRARKAYREYINEGGLLELYRAILKPKPKWCPMFLWIFGAKIFLRFGGDNAPAS